MQSLIAKILMKLFDIHNSSSDNCPLNSRQAEYLIKCTEDNASQIKKLKQLAYLTIAIITLFGSTNLMSSL